MAIEENDDEGSKIELHDDNPSSDYLLCTFEEMHKDMQKLLKGNNVLKVNGHLFLKEIKIYLIKMNS